jgi:hypothetical protein
MTGLALDSVTEYAKARRRWRGLPVLRQAVALADPRARSKGESLLRLVWRLDAGLPTPEVNASVRNLDGRLLGIADLLDPAAGLVGEYDGALHREAESHTRDNAREEWLEDAGLIVVRATSIDLRRRFVSRTVLRLRTAYRRGLARDRNRDRWMWTP